MTTRHNAILKFNSDTSEVVRLSVPRADYDLTPAQARTAMEGMIDLGIVTSSQGMPIGIKGAEIVTTERTTIVSNP